MDLESVKYMPGTTGGKYFPFARKGNVLLGIQPVGAIDGAMYNLPGTTYFAYRLRSAPANGLFAEEDAAKSVVKLQANPENLWDAWPAVKKWEKRNNERASVTTGVFIRGRLKTNLDDNEELPTELKTLFANIEYGKLGVEVAKGLMALAGEDYLIVNKDDLADFAQTHVDALIESVKKKVAMGIKLHEAASASVGVFGVQAELLAKVYEEVHGKPPEDEPEAPVDGDETDPEDDDDHGHDDHED